VNIKWHRFSGHGVNILREGKPCPSDILALSYGRIAKIAAQFSHGLVNSAMGQIPCSTERISCYYYYYYRSIDVMSSVLCAALLISSLVHLWYLQSIFFVCLFIFFRWRILVHVLVFPKYPNLRITVLCKSSVSFHSILIENWNINSFVSRCVHEATLQLGPIRKRYCIRCQKLTSVSWDLCCVRSTLCLVVLCSNGQHTCKQQTLGHSHYLYTELENHRVRKPYHVNSHHRSNSIYVAC